MTRGSGATTKGGARTAELEAMSALREIREQGGFVLVDLRGNLLVHHIRRVPVELKARLIRYYPEIVQLLLASFD